MANSISFGSSPVLSPFPDPTRSRIANPFHRRPQFGSFSKNPKPLLIGRTLTVARFGLGHVQFPDPENFRELIDRAEGVLYTIADAVVAANPDSGVTTNAGAKQSSDWLSGISNYMETVLKFLKDGLSTLHVPYAYGFAIILLTVLVKAATFPLSKKQVESAMAMRSLQPQIKAIQERYAGDQERLQLETARLYKLAGINPLAGCLPTLATIPVWIGLYRALSNVADEGLLAEGFFWIPSLAGPTTIAARQSGSGISWLFPFVDGHPPLGWSDTFAYLVLPVLLVLSQYISVQIMQSSQPQSNDPNMKTSQTITKFLPLMIGYFALSVPSGLSLYWLTNNILSSAQQIWLQKMGGANNLAKKINFEMLKEDPPKVQESVFQTTSVKEPPKIEKPDSQGYRPGERFKQLKEQEARRKQQKEAEKAKEASLTNEAVRGDVKVDHELKADSMNSVNGDPSSSDSSQVDKTMISKIENGEDSVLYNSRRDQQQHLDENLEKEKTATCTTENKSATKDEQEE
ncbi:putative membrane insertase YidC/ALB3/OXA1/COX18, membrane insertase YidC/Oxa1 [Helianthus annuus]|uniref:Membrane insertase YidC/ALB3/OXA1/COX18, membrane insertase YidC/Oxa1 n=1 Tax=Helianthus annuus TaxID=4232 RepID=A0A251U140_HELAN|nr:ALBINO3-like protein 1, chloroplastic [Helianthus annuus]KAF5793646.1 putative membrane insertase YidC/ALB3/OXA1/COX18, membrane insertase YidC/Oxa1 [Helianthus annuus]KAJ0537393.1 putative membrane insertase YidC/ALB3/OXA1/COX18, membrane insertase YidC/Oxa1 [Helianthus annuus]KAJ0544911.1 putative membrane insertase YidC/ALB3/OXA1/COX18, membrane insertase YidC/Oxa1 [Helianthus annuus]KAJ0551975.1 putative membrane insertase YidC/ALB3/OXA1/COX18, membrane insertase YidC/Oxa1 [Helianthus an